MFDMLNRKDPNLRGLYDPVPTPGSSLPGDPGLGDGLRTFTLGTIRLDEPDTLVLREPAEGKTGTKNTARVERCAAGEWNVAVARIWVDKWVRTATYEIRFALVTEPDDGTTWPWPEDEYDDDDQNTPAPVGPGTTDGISGCFYEDGGTVVAAFEAAAARAGSRPDWTDLTAFLFESSRKTGSMDFSPRLVGHEHKVGVFDSINACGATPRVRRCADGLAVEIRIGLHGTDDLPAELDRLNQEHAELTARLAVLDADGGYPAETPRCSLCGRGGTVRVPALTLLRIARVKSMSVMDLHETLPPDLFEQALTGMHPGCRDEFDRRVGFWLAGQAAGAFSKDDYPWADHDGLDRDGAPVTDRAARDAVAAVRASGNAPGPGGHPAVLYVSAFHETGLLTTPTADALARCIEVAHKDPGSSNADGQYLWAIAYTLSFYGLLTGDPDPDGYETWTINPPTIRDPGADEDPDENDEDDEPPQLRPVGRPVVRRRRWAVGELPDALAFAAVHTARLRGTGPVGRNAAMGLPGRRLAPQDIRSGENGAADRARLADLAGTLWPAPD